MKRVLVIDEDLPFPANSGKRIRTTELLRRLASDVEITFAFHAEGPTAEADVQAARDAGLRPLAVRRRPLVKHGLRFAWDLGRNVALPVPYMVMAHRTRAMRDAVAQALAGPTPPDVIHVEWTPLLANVAPDAGVPTCVAAHNVEADIWRRYRENAPWGPRKAYIALQHRKVLRYEKKAFAAADVVTAVSEHDGVRIAEMAGHDRVQVVPNGVNAGYFAPQADAAVEADEIVFVGALDWRPNQDGFAWFVDEVLPKARALRPNLRLTLVGRNPTDGVRARAEATPGVTLHASVPDVRPYMARAAALVVPLRIGGGSRLKICEALAMGRPVVSTSIGAEGLELGDGLVRADGADALAQAVVDTLADPPAAQAMADRGRERVLARYEWDVIAPRQAEAWARAYSRREARA